MRVRVAKFSSFYHKRAIDILLKMPYNVVYTTIEYAIKEFDMDNRFIGIRLRSLNNAIRRYLDRYTHSMHNSSITCSNAWIIGFLSDARGDVYQRDLEEQFGITRSTASKVLILLEKKGMIRREGVAHDARLKKLVLTEQAQKMAAEMERNGKVMEDQLTKGFSEEELRLLESFICRMEANLGEGAGSPDEDMTAQGEE